jgi:hypothetical protein
MKKNVPQYSQNILSQHISKSETVLSPEILSKISKNVTHVK